MIPDKFRKYGLNAVLLIILLVYSISILWINFSKNPDFYITDMYSDMNYAAEVWNQKSIFPDGWVFGNQLYVVATPVLASLFYGLCNDHCVAMGIASSVMGIGVLLSFHWMLKPIFQTIRERLLCIVVFMSVVLLFGNPVDSIHGWQLFFTMCSYYACYAISVFLAFGCYLRSDRDWSFQQAAILFIACVLSFGTGMQSLRQTLIMVCPLIAIELAHAIYRCIHKEKVAKKSLLVMVLITASNLSGVLCSKMLNVDQVEIFGDITITNILDAFSNILPSIYNAFSLFFLFHKAVVYIFAVICLSVVSYLIYKFIAVKNRKALLCLSLFLVSLFSVLLVDIFSTMQIRYIYYFLLYPLSAFLVISLYSYAGKAIRYSLIGVLTVLFIFNCIHRLSPAIKEAAPNHAYEEVVNYLEEEEITTIFTSWNHGEKIAISSNWEIDAGFWRSPYAPFEGIHYICNPKVFDADPAHSAYVFFKKREAAIAAEKASEMNVDFTLVKYFADSGIYIYTSNTNLMQRFPPNGN